jgi:hypothetical protein
MMVWILGPFSCSMGGQLQEAGGKEGGDMHDGTASLNFLDALLVSQLASPPRVSAARDHHSITPSGPLRGTVVPCPPREQYPFSP